MTWQAFQWTFELESPLHVGFHKVMHLYRTRPYLPGRNLWAAITARLTQLTGTMEYAPIGERISQCMRFGYLYPCEDGQVLLPKLTCNGWKYGDMSRHAFEGRYLHAVASTAIESFSLTAEDESLHEVEILAPWHQRNNRLQKTTLTGLLWMKSELVTPSDIRIQLDDCIRVDSGACQWSLTEVVEDLQVGGERRYGFGRIRLKDAPQRLRKRLGPFPGHFLEGTGEAPLVVLGGQEREHMWAHTELDGVNCSGEIEAVVGRDWDVGKGAGRRLSPGKLYWMPGSTVNCQGVFEISPMGFWKPRTDLS